MPQIKRCLALDYTWMQGGQSKDYSVISKITDHESLLHDMFTWSLFWLALCPRAYLVTVADGSISAQQIQSLTTNTGNYKPKQTSTAYATKKTTIWNMSMLFAFSGNVSCDAQQLKKRTVFGSLAWLFSTCPNFGQKGLHFVEHMFFGPACIQHTTQTFSFKYVCSYANQRWSCIAQQKPSKGRPGMNLYTFTVYEPLRVHEYTYKCIKVLRGFMWFDLNNLQLPDFHSGSRFLL